MSLVVTSYKDSLVAILPIQNSLYKPKNTVTSC